MFPFPLSNILDCVSRRLADSPPHKFALISDELDQSKFTLIRIIEDGVERQRNIGEMFHFLSQGFIEISHPFPCLEHSLLVYVLCNTEPVFQLFGSASSAGKKRFIAD